MSQPTVIATPRTIGFDIGARTSVFCVLDTSGEVSEEGSVAMAIPSVKMFFDGQPTSRVVLEASGSSRWTAQLAMGAGHEVIIGNPRKLRHITKSYTKSDRNDAYRLADLGQVRPRLLSPVRLRTDKSHYGRMHQRMRTQLIEIRTSLVNLVRGCARSTGHALPKCSTKTFVKVCMQHLPAEPLRILEPALEQLRAVGEQIAKVDKETARLGEEEFPEAAVLRQIAGVGPVLSLAFVCAIDDPTNFEDSRSVGAYFGLAPKSRQSGSRAPQLRISKQGDPEVRRLLVSAATYILGPFGPDCDLRRHGERIRASGSQASRAKARIAVARKLAVLLHRLWITGEVYDPQRSQPSEAKTAS